MIVGYRRQSTLDQEAGWEAQERKLTEAGCEKLFGEKVSSVAARTELERALDFVREGDVFVVTSLSRLARSVLHLWQIVEKLQAKGVTLRILDMGINTSTSHGRLVLTLIGGIVQWEREVMLERQQEGIAKARQAKKYTGRKPSIDAAQVKALRAEGL